MAAPRPVQAGPVVVRTDPTALATCLAQHLVGWLDRVLADQAHAVLAVSGGRTPLRCFDALAAADLPWHRVVVTLVDDRAVPHDHPRSNTGLVRDHLLQGPAARARFVPLTTPSGRPLAALDLPGPVDLAHFGMGTDGHTASWFPGGDHLAAALAPEGPALLPLAAAGAPEPRTTFTWAALRRARHAVLHFEGVEKAATYDLACGDGPMEGLPVRRLIRQDDVPLTVFTDTPPRTAPTPEPAP